MEYKTLLHRMMEVFFCCLFLHVSIRSPSTNERWFLKATLASCSSSIGSKFSLPQILGYKAMSRKEPNSSCFQVRTFLSFLYDRLNILLHMPSLFKLGYIKLILGCFCFCFSFF